MIWLLASRVTARDHRGTWPPPLENNFWRKFVSNHSLIVLTLSPRVSVSLVALRVALLSLQEVPVEWYVDWLLSRSKRWVIWCLIFAFGVYGWITVVMSYDSPFCMPLYSSNVIPINHPMQCTQDAAIGLILSFRSGRMPGLTVSPLHHRFGAMFPVWRSGRHRTRRYNLRRYDPCPPGGNIVRLVSRSSTAGTLRMFRGMLLVIHRPRYVSHYSMLLPLVLGSACCFNKNKIIF